MRWKGRRQSQNVEDRRGQRGPKLALGGGLGAIVAVVVVMLLGGDPSQVLSLLNSGAGSPPAGQAVDLNDESSQFVKTVLADTETVWGTLFRQQGGSYVQPGLILYSGATRMTDGHMADARTGPFYYPKEQKVYIDLSFFDEMKNRLRAGGDFAYAYVIVPTPALLERLAE